MSRRAEFRARVKGTVVPMPTPFKHDLCVDFEGVRRYTNFLIEGGIQVISPLGTTGEFFTLTPEEHRAVMRAGVEEAAGRAVVIAGAGHSGTAVAIKHDWFASLKAAQEMFGLPGGPSRLPVVTVSKEGRQELRDVLVRTGLLPS